MTDPAGQVTQGIALVSSAFVSSQVRDVVLQFNFITTDACKENTVPEPQPHNI